MRTVDETDMVCSLTLCFLAATGTDVASASRRMATICSRLNRLFLMGSSLTKSHLPKNYWSEETGQVTSPGAVEDPRGRRTGHAGMDLLVQPPSFVGANRLHPARGGRSNPLSSIRRAGHVGLTQTNGPPRNPRRFSMAISRPERRCRVEQCPRQTVRRGKGPSAFTSR